MDAIEDARLAADVTSGWCCGGASTSPASPGWPPPTSPLDAATRLAPDGLVGFGLGGPEIGVSRGQFRPYFDAARATGLHCVPHAGETTGPQTIRDAIEFLGAERIGHGISAAQDPVLMDDSPRTGIPLEVCPRRMSPPGPFRASPSPRSADPGGRRRRGVDQFR